MSADDKPIRRPRTSIRPEDLDALESRVMSGLREQGGRIEGLTAAMQESTVQRATITACMQDVKGQLEGINRRLDKQNGRLEGCEHATTVATTIIEHELRPALAEQRAFMWKLIAAAFTASAGGAGVITLIANAVK